MATAVLGGWLGDKYGKRAVLTSVFLIIWPPIVWQAFTTSFTVVAVLNLYGGLFGGLLGGPINGLMADVLPTGSDGKPTHPTRDWNLICQAWSLPGIVFPLILGSAFQWPIFPTQRSVYTAFFCVNAMLNVAQIPVLYPLDFEPNVGKDGKAKRTGLRVVDSIGDERVFTYDAPMGARCCDLLCFPKALGKLETELQEMEEGAKGAEGRPAVK